MRARVCFFFALIALGTAACSGNPVAVRGDDGGPEAGPSIPPDAASRPMDAAPNDARADAPDPPDAADAGAMDAAADAGHPIDASFTDAGTDGGTISQLPLVLDTATGDLSGIALDDTNVYYAVAGGVKGVARTGGAPFVVAQSTQPSFGGSLQLVNGTLFWDPDELSLRSIDVNARNAPSALIGTFGTHMFAFAIAGGAAYAAYACSEIVDLPLSSAGAAASTFVSEGCNAIPQWIALVSDTASGTLDTLDRYRNVVNRISLSTKQISSFSVPPKTGTLMLYSNKLYWVTYGGCDADGGCTPSTLTAAALDGTSPTTIATGSWFTSNAYAGVQGIITRAYVYLVIDTNVVRINLTTGENHVVYTSMGPIGAIAADADYLFVGDRNIGILRIPN